MGEGLANASDAAEFPNGDALADALDCGILTGFDGDVGALHDVDVDVSDLI